MSPKIDHQGLFSIFSAAVNTSKDPIVILLRVPKSSRGGTSFSYRRLEEIFFLYGMIEKTKFYCIGT